MRLAAPGKHLRLRHRFREKDEGTGRTLIMSPTAMNSTPAPLLRKTQRREKATCGLSKDPTTSSGIGYAALWLPAMNLILFVSAVTSVNSHTARVKPLHPRPGTHR